MKPFVMLGVAVALFAMLAAPPARAQDGAALCRVGQKVEYAKFGRRYPGEVRGSDGRRCQVYAPDYLGIIDVDMADLRPVSGAPKGAGKPDLVAGGPVVSVTAKQISDAFERDPANAKATWLGRKVRVTSQFWHLGSDSASIKSNIVQVAAKCWIEASDRPQWRTVPDGAQVTVEGSATDWGNTGIALQDCQLVGQGGAPVMRAGPARPPLGRYFCRSAGQGIGTVNLSANRYIVDGVSGAWRFEPATNHISFPSGSYAKWGWGGEWRTDPDGVGGPPEPRMVLRDGKGLKVTCTPQP